MWKRAGLRDIIPYPQMKKLIYPHVEHYNRGQMSWEYLFTIDDLESGLLYGNFIVKEGIPKIKTWVGTAKNELVTDLVDAW